MANDALLAPWLDNVPTSWDSRRLKFIVEYFYSGGTPSTNSPEYWEGAIPWVSPKDMKCWEIPSTEDNISELAMSEAGLRELEPNHVLLVVRSGILKHSIPVARNLVPTAVNQDIKALKCVDNLTPEYLAYFIHGLQKSLLPLWRKPGTTVESLEYTYYSNEKVPIPPLPEQNAIVSYLNRKTLEIGALIEKKLALLDLLAEKRSALITTAVKCGIDPEAHKKDSGIDWLGDVPTHWNCDTPIKYLTRTSGGMTPLTTNPDYWEGDIPWVSPKDMKLSELHDSEDHVTELALEETSLRLIEPGAVLIVVRGMILAHTFPVAINRVPVTLNQDMKALIPEDRLNAEFLALYLCGISEHALSLVETSAHGTKALRTDRWRELIVPLPPLEEQKEIVKKTNAKIRDIEELEKTIVSTIQRLEEYRSALITDAVTGKIRVPEAKREGEAA